MEENKTPPAPTEPKPTEPKPTEPKPTEPKPTEPKPTEPSFKQTVEEIKKTYEKQISELKQSHADEIKEREDIIKQLISGEETEVTAPQSIAEQLNSQRNFKKW